MQLANETVAMLKLFTEALADAFTMPEIVQRLADMLDYNLEALAGPKSNNLKVVDPESYHFNPKALLSDIVDVYLNLKTKKPFIEAVARDGRSYKPDTFKGATWILKRFSLRAPDEIRAWEGLMDEFKKAYEEDLQLEEDLGDIPEEFQGTSTLTNKNLCSLLMLPQTLFYILSWPIRLSYQLQKYLLIALRSDLISSQTQMILSIDLH